MCGRFAIYSDPDTLRNRFRLNSQSSLFSNYNASPGQILPVVISDIGGNHLESMIWGLIPSWAKDPKISHRLINARADSIAVKPSFRDSLRYRRCLVPANGYYEWHAHHRIKTPYYFTLKSTPLFAFAGLYASRTLPNGSLLNTFTIITTDSHDVAACVHRRMPLILKPGNETSWLDPNLEDISTILSLLVSPPETDYRYYPVSPLVNQTQVNTPDLITPQTFSPS